MILIFKKTTKKATHMAFINILNTDKIQFIN